MTLIIRMVNFLDITQKRYSSNSGRSTVGEVLVVVVVMVEQE